MAKFWKKALALSMSVLMLPAALAACGGDVATETTAVPGPTESPEEAKVLKVLTLGHSLALDACHMLAMIAVKEGYDGLKIGTLYNGGASLKQHVIFLTEDSREYELYVSSTETPDEIPQIMENVSMRDAIKFDNWDVFIMQSGTSKAINSEVYTNGDIQTIQQYVNEHKTNPTARFAWNMTWATPTDNTLRDMYPYPESNPYYAVYKQYNDERSLFYQDVAKNVKDHIITDDTFAFLIPSGTAFENAISSYLDQTDLHRDYAHASDFGRVVASYTWLCAIKGIEKLDEIKLDKVPVKFFKSTKSQEDWVLTDMEKAIILEAVNNAIAEPLKMTQSQYTTAPQ